MNASQLKARYETLKPDGKFFCRENMRFAGDTMKNYGVGKFTHDDSLWYCLYRKRPVKHGMQTSHYFRHDDMYETTQDPDTGDENRQWYEHYLAVSDSRQFKDINLIGIKKSLSKGSDYIVYRVPGRIKDKYEIIDGVPQVDGAMIVYSSVDSQ